MADGKFLAAARDAWQASDEGRMLASDINGPVGGKCLRNRLELAFIAGYESAERAAGEMDVSEEMSSLPPLPRPWGTDYDDIDNEEVETFTASQMKAYARAALSAALRIGGGG